MPKRKRISKRSSDVNVWAHQIGNESTQERDSVAPVTMSQSEVSRFMAEMGRRGGKIGGKKRAENMTQQQRRESASKAARARWGKEESTPTPAAPASPNPSPLP